MITVCIATIPPRAPLLAKAVASVAAQSRQPAAIIVEYDHHHTGAAATKNRALAKVDTEFVAFLDDDDLFMPHHLDALATCQEQANADLVYSIPHIPQIPGHRDPDGRYGVPFDPDELLRRSYIQTTSLARTDLMRAAGGFQCRPGYEGRTEENYDDWGCWVAMLNLGARIVHHPAETFVWNHWGYGVPGRQGNTSGRPDRW